VEVNSTGGQGSRRTVAPSDDDDIQELLVINTLTYTSDFILDSVFLLSRLLHFTLHRYDAKCHDCQLKVGFLHINCLYNKNMILEKFRYAMSDNKWPSVRKVCFQYKYTHILEIIMHLLSLTQCCSIFSESNIRTFSVI
jgi:hypothetical protein